MATSDQNPKITPTDLPHHLIFGELLPRFPAKSLTRFKSVAREWKSVISSVKFANTHLRHHSRSSVLTQDADIHSHLVAVDYYNDADPNYSLEITDFGDEFRAHFDCLKASCNGLAFFVASPNQATKLGLGDRNLDDDNSYDFSYVVYNPVLGVGDYVEIPHPCRFPLGDTDKDYDDLINSRDYSFGFGYDSCSDDYYIVAISLPGNSEFVVYVYSLRYHVWELPGTGTITLNGDHALAFQDVWFRHIGTLVNETLHWGMSQGSEQFIFAFSLATRNVGEKFRLPYANFGNSLGSATAFSLCCLGDRLCAWANYEANVVEMWMMREYGDCESWTSLFRFQPDADQTCCRDFFGFTKFGKVLVFTTDDQLFLADFINEPPTLFDPVLEVKLHAVNYIPSLVSVLAIISEPTEGNQ